MKRMIKASSSAVDNYLRYYFDEAVEDGKVSKNDANYIEEVNWGNLTEEDIDLFLEGFKAFPLSVVKQVDDLVDVAEDAGYDGGYKVILRNGREANYGWYFGKPQLYPLY